MNTTTYWIASVVLSLIIGGLVGRRSLVCPDCEAEIKHVIEYRDCPIPPPEGSIKAKNRMINAGEYRDSVKPGKSIKAKKVEQRPPEIDINN